jgi:hypothetical protein
MIWFFSMIRKMIDCNGSKGDRPAEGNCLAPGMIYITGGRPAPAAIRPGRQNKRQALTPAFSPECAVGCRRFVNQAAACERFNPLSRLFSGRSPAAEPRIEFLQCLIRRR